jgi:hypothetical protein
MATITQVKDRTTCSCTGMTLAALEVMATDGQRTHESSPVGGAIRPASAPTPSAPPKSWRRESRNSVTMVGPSGGGSRPDRRPFFSSLRAGRLRYASLSTKFR